MDSKEQECRSSGNAKSTHGAGESSKDTGPMLPGFETCETATEEKRVLWPTMYFGTNRRGAYAVGHIVDKLKRGVPSPKTVFLSDAVIASPPLTSSAADFLASPSATPASVRENPIAAGFGLSSTESFAKLNPDGSWQKMYLGCGQWMMDGSLEGYFETWPKRGTMRSGSTYPLPMLERPTSESEYSLWPTVTAQDASNDAGPSQWERNSDPLNVAVKRWPTPKGSPEKFGRLRPNDRGDLQAAVWPTPMPSDVDGGRTTKGRHRPNETGLRVAVTTPTADDTGYRRQQYAQGGTALSTQIGGQLNPTFVEWLMGFPKDWSVV